MQWDQQQTLKPQTRLRSCIDSYQKQGQDAEQLWCKAKSWSHNQALETALTGLNDHAGEVNMGYDVD